MCPTSSPRGTFGNYPWRRNPKVCATFHPEVHLVRKCPTFLLEPGSGGDASGHRVWLVRGLPAISESCAPGDICRTRRGEAGAARAARALRGARLRSRCERRSIEVQGEGACTLRTPPAPRFPERAREPVQLGCTFSRRFGRALRTSCACGRLCPTTCRHSAWQVVGARPSIHAASTAHRGGINQPIFKSVATVRQRQ